MGEVVGMKKRQEPLKKIGCFRSADCPNVLSFAFNRAPTDDEMRFIDDVMARAACLVQTVVEDKSN